MKITHRETESLIKVYGSIENYHRFEHVLEELVASMIDDYQVDVRDGSMSSGCIIRFPRCFIPRGFNNKEGMDWKDDKRLQIYLNYP